jgi:predicted GNAT family acetyltransferase
MAVGDTIAFLDYRREDGRIVLTHTEVPEALSGQGVGSKLVRAVLERLRADGMPVVSRCRFVTIYVKRHPEYRDLLADRGSEAESASAPRPAERRGPGAPGSGDENMEIIARQERERGAWGVDEA